ncbi:MAG: hypothetical protein O7C58_00195 [Rickettsia endosymbiont of Ixodes persulcatus]|nr:hypothetical protein [Rickettsia endosymbiont of Ixodes persulcatus]
MGYLVQGNEQQFKQAWPQALNAPVHQSLLGLHFLGSNEQAQQYLNEWQKNGNHTDSSEYLKKIFGSGSLLKKSGESEEEYQQHLVHQHFAYVNEKLEPCQLLIMYRRDVPSQWALGLIKNPHVLPAEREVFCLTGFDLRPYISDPELPILGVPWLANPFVEQLQSPLIKKIMSQVLFPSMGIINIKVERLTQWARFISLDNNIVPKQHAVISDDLLQTLLEQENPILDLICKYKIILSPSMLQESLVADSGLCNEIDSFSFTADERINQNLLEMLIVFYEEGIIKSHRDFLRKEFFNRTQTDSLWESEQIKLIPFLIKKQYSHKLLQTILSKKAYYTAVYHLMNLGLTQDVPAFFGKADKLKDLELIYSLTHNDPAARKISLIFWVKGTLHASDYQQLVDATHEHPLLAETLIALDQSHTLSNAELHQLALTPQDHAKQSLSYHFKDEFFKYGLELSDLDKFNEHDLSALSQCFQVLKNTDKGVANTYRLLMQETTTQARLARLFLPGLATMKPDYKNQLINILFLGIQAGAVSQGNAILAIKDAGLLPHAQELHQRFICTKQLVHLTSNAQVINFVAQANTLQASKLRQIIVTVEKQCKLVHHQLIDSKVDSHKIDGWQKADEVYRRELYQIAFDELQKPTAQFRAKINRAQDNVLKLVDPEIQSSLKKAFIIIANVIIYLVTLGRAHNRKEKETGDCWFFKHSKSGEQILALNKQVTQIIDPPEEDIAPAPK